MYGLNQLKVGERAYVRDTEGAGGMQRRLLDLGFTAGAPVRCLFRGPSGDPTAYFVRGAVIALRGEDARMVRVDGRRRDEQD